MKELPLFLLKHYFTFYPSNIFLRGVNVAGYSYPNIRI